MKTMIVVNLQVEGIHHWPGCDMEDVSFLKEPHRHIFHIAVKTVVGHNDRAVEIIQFKREIEKLVKAEFGAAYSPAVNFGSLSCEMIAEKILNVFEADYVSVLEDGENGAEVTR